LQKDESAPVFSRHFIPNKEHAAKAVSGFNVALVRGSAKEDHAPRRVAQHSVIAREVQQREVELRLAVGHQEGCLDVPHARSLDRTKKATTTTESVVKHAVEETLIMRPICALLGYKNH
jgi:hypothetical protein